MSFSASEESNVYLSMDASDIADDRRAISEKLRRHQLQKQGSRRQGGFEMTSEKVMNSDEETLYESILEEDYGENENGYGDNSDSSDYGDSIGVLRSALCNEGTAKEMHSSFKGQPSAVREEPARLRRHASTQSPIADCVDIPQIKIGRIVVPSTQSRAKNLTALLYILLCVALLVSYAFFLGSCKLMNYGT
jgi:hypothetical protein